MLLHTLHMYIVLLCSVRICESCMHRHVELVLNLSLIHLDILWTNMLQQEGQPS